MSKYPGARVLATIRKRYKVRAHFGRRVHFRGASEYFGTIVGGSDEGMGNKLVVLFDGDDKPTRMYATSQFTYLDEIVKVRA